MGIESWELEENELSVLIKNIKYKIKNSNIVILLQGDLACGKTTLVKEYVKSLELDDKVTSPTFSLQTLYGKNIFHYDVYNKTLEQFIALGLLEEFEKDGIHFVEWGDEKLKAILKEYGFNVLTVQIKKLENKREYKIEL